jgi:hypothetical protein
MLLAPCGIDCKSCDFNRNHSCGGCYAIEGKPFYVQDFGMDVCPMYDCSVNKNGYKSCAECSELPCQIFYEWKDPSMTDEEHITSIHERAKILKATLE